MLDEDSLREQSLTNLIGFYEEELKQIFKGVSVEELFTESERKMLRNKGILRFNHQEWYLSEKVKDIIISKVSSED